MTYFPKKEVKIKKGEKNKKKEVVRPHIFAKKPPKKVVKKDTKNALPETEIWRFQIPWMDQDKKLNI